MLVLLPLWTSYLVRIYAWRLILAKQGALNWALNGIGLPDANLAYTNTAMWIVFSYVWLPFMVLPVYAALERIPQSYLEASQDLGARSFRTFRTVILPLALPGLVAGSIFTFSLTLGDFITPALVGGADSQFIGNVVHNYVGISNNVPLAAAFATAAGDRDGRLPRDREATRRVRGPLMETRATRIGLGAATTLVIAFLWIPILIILAYAFNGSVLQTWPIQNLTLHWFHEALGRPGGPLVALALGEDRADRDGASRMVLGTAASFAISRFRFFGREGISFLLLLPIALPGIITGMALSSFYTFAGIGFSIWTIVIGHATFCVVVVYNNVLARLRRTSPSIVEASMDLGADGWQTFRFVIWPVISTALVAGGAARVRALVRRGDRDARSPPARRRRSRSSSSATSSAGSSSRS